jgi:hypothetical protein
LVRGRQRVRREIMVITVDAAAQVAASAVSA